MFRVSSCIALLLSALPCASRAQTQNWFPVQANGAVAPGSAVDASALLVDVPGEDVNRVVDKRGRLFAAADGHFYFTNTGSRARFFGTNLMSNTIFPPNADAPQQRGEYSAAVPPDAADTLAIRLSRMGVNLVRLHFIDGAYCRPVSIWSCSFPGDTQHLDATQVRRLDYLIFRLKQYGIYTNINLHTGRNFLSGDGVQDWNLFSTYTNNKPAVQFDARMIELQKQYAAQVLTHVNRYTGMRLADDPAVAFVEIDNEDSILYSFATDMLHSTPGGFCGQGLSCGLPPSYSAQLDRMWNAWLQSKYKGDSALADAWKPAPIVNQVKSPGFDAGAAVWTLRVFNDAVGSWSNVSDAPAPSTSSARIDIGNSNAPWAVQLDQGDLTLTQGQTYQVTFWAKGTPGTSVEVAFIHGLSPFTYYQSAGSSILSGSWQPVTLTFQANQTDEGHAQMNLDVGAAAGTVWISGVTLSPARLKGLQVGEAALNSSVQRVRVPDLPQYTVARNQDLWSFYYELEQSYLSEMRDYLKNALGVKSMIAGSQPFATPLDADLQSQQDYVDEHFYWDYPVLGQDSGALSNWTIQNRSFTSNASFYVFNLALTAVAGKPFSISESGVPFPNDSFAEWLPWVTQFGNFQDWDSLVQYTFTGWPDNFNSNVPSGWVGNYFFGLSNNIVVSSQFPVAARAFLAYQNAPATNRMTLAASRTDIANASRPQVVGNFFNTFGFAGWQGMVNSLRASYGGPTSRQSWPGEGPAVISSDNGEMTYDRSSPASALLKLSSTYLQSATGYLAGKTISLSNMTILSPANTAPFAAVTLQTLDGQAVSSSGRLLLTVATRYQNTGMGWNSTRTSVGTAWGQLPRLVEPFNATYTFLLNPNALFQVFALDNAGNRIRQVAEGSGQFQAALNPADDRTLWYEIAATQTLPVQPVNGQSYYVLARNSGKCLDVSGGPSATGNGSAVQQWGCWGSAGQIWRLQSNDDGSWTFVARHSGKALDVTGGPTANGDGVPLQQWDSWGGSCQRWYTAPQPDGTYLLKSQSSGKCVSVAGGGSANGDGLPILQNTCDGSPGQQWKLLPVH